MIRLAYVARPDLFTYFVALKSFHNKNKDLKRLEKNVTGKTASDIVQVCFISPTLIEKLLEQN